MNIEVSISRCIKPFAGLITGTDEKYGFALEFVREIKRHSDKYHTITITEAGIYKLPVPGASVTIGNRGITTGYISVAIDGTVTEISKDDAVKSLEKTDASLN